MNKEYRSTEQPKADQESRKVSGYAIVFNSESEDLGFREIIKPGAVDDDTIKRSDVFACFEHDRSKVLARSRYGEGSLKLEVDEKGLRYEFEAPHTSAGDDLLEFLRRGDIMASSFCFSVDPSDKKAESWEQRDGVMYRTIRSIAELYDIAPVFQPAYEATSCTMERFAKAKATAKEINSILDAEFEAVKIFA